MGADEKSKGRVMIEIFVRDSEVRMCAVVGKSEDVVAVPMSVTSGRWVCGSPMEGELGYKSMVSVGSSSYGVVTRGVKVEVVGRDSSCGGCDVREGVVVVGVPRNAADGWGRMGWPEGGELARVVCT